MPNDFYVTLCKEIEDLLDDQNYDQVIARMNEELSMPYVPLAYEDQFRRYLTFAKQASRVETKKEIMEEETFEMLLQDPSLEAQLLAIEGLRAVNYVPYLPAIDAYLRAPMFEEVQSLLIYELIERGVREEFTTPKDGMEVVFMPYYLELPQDSDSYLACVSYMEEAVEKNPSLLQLCLQVLQVLYMKKLPLSFDDDEVEQLAASVIFYACHALQDQTTWVEVAKRFDIEEENLINIVLD